MKEDILGLRAFTETILSAPWEFALVAAVLLGGVLLAYGIGRR